MRRVHLISLGLLAISLSACLSITNAQDQPDDESRQPVPSARGRFVMPKFFDFNIYKRLFHKHYPSLVQELARQKLFLVKAFNAFISAIKYKYRKSDYYSGINQLSDRTPEELAKRINRRLSGHRHEHDAVNPIEATQVEYKIEAADRVDVERELKDILESRDSEPGLKEIAEEISQVTSGSRKRRNADPRDISVENLIRPTVEVTKNEKIVNSVPTNNPNYERLELMSFGTNNDNGEPEIPSNEVSFINSLPGAEFISSMRHQLVAAFNGWDNGEQSVNKSTKLRSRSRINKQHPQLEDAPIEDAVYVDLRGTKCFLEPRDQGDCGSCYIFSTISLLEWAHCMQTGKLVAFSEQYAVDCGFRAGLEGCAGGNEHDVIGFVKHYGLELHRNYPYKASEGTCPYPRGTDRRVMGYIKTKDVKLRDTFSSFRMVEKALKRYPLLATIDTPYGFYDYGGGIHPGKRCLPEDGGSHAMLLVGSGRQDNQEYWLLRNSYSTDWGDGGYFKLNKESPCLVLNETISFRSDFEIFTDKNPDYKGFRLTRKHDLRDPDAPENSKPPPGPVHNG